MTDKSGKRPRPPARVDGARAGADEYLRSLRRLVAAYDRLLTSLAALRDALEAEVPSTTPPAYVDPRIGDVVRLREESGGANLLVLDFDPAHDTVTVGAREYVASGASCVFEATTGRAGLYLVARARL